MTRRDHVDASGSDGIVGGTLAARSRRMQKLITPALLMVALQACATDDATTSHHDATEVLPLYDGATHRLGRETQRIDATGIVLSDGAVELPAELFLGELDLASFTHVDLTLHQIDDGWTVKIAPGRDLSRQARGGAYCEEWVTRIYYQHDGTILVVNSCRAWINL